MKQISAKDNTAKDFIMPESEFKGYTIEEIRFQRALVALQADFAKTKFIKSWNELQGYNPLSKNAVTKITGKAGGIALKMLKGLNYLDYVFLGVSVYSGIKKIAGLFSRKKRK